MKPLTAVIAHETKPWIDTSGKTQSGTPKSVVKDFLPADMADKDQADIPTAWEEES